MNHQVPPEGHKLTDQQWFTLRALADVIVPPSAQYGVPGAGDEAICKYVINDAAKRLPRLIEALATLNDIAHEVHGAAFVELDEAQRETSALLFRDGHQAAAGMAEVLVTQCYYRDDRVVRSLGMELRPPHPEGYAVDQGDWSVLDQVRKRQPFHRRVE